MLRASKRLQGYNGGQKCWDLSSDITKPSDPSPPTPNKVEFGAKWVKLSAFFGHNIARGSGGDDGMNPKPNKKMSLGAESYGIIACKGFFTQSQVLLSSIIVGLKNHLISILGARHFLKPHSISNALFK